MFDRIVRAVIGLFGLAIGYGIAVGIGSFNVFGLSNKGWISLAIHLGIGLILGIIFFLLAPRFIRRGRRLISFIEVELQNVPAYEIILGSVGLIVGLIIAYLLSQPFYKLNVPYLGVIISIMLYLIFGYLGIKIPTRKKEDFSNALGSMKKSPEIERASCRERV